MHPSHSTPFPADLLKLPRLLRLGRLTRKLELLAAANAFRIVVLLMGFLLLAHIMACSWWFLGVQVYSVSACGWGAALWCLSFSLTRCC